MVRILFIADITGRPGRWVVSQLLWGLKRKYTIDFVIANVENAAGGYGVTPEISAKIFQYGVDVQTSGNHIWDRPDIHETLDNNPKLLRPANFPKGAPGSGAVVTQTEAGVAVGVINLQGRVFIKEIDCPFQKVDRLLEKMRPEAKVIFVDFHAEATSEKQALAYYLDGKVSAVVGTHTHVQTADEKIHRGGTAYLSDAGMTGPHDSILGVRPKDAIYRILTGLPRRFQMAEDDVRFNGVIVGVDETTGKAVDIERLDIAYDGSVPPREFLGLPPREDESAEEQPVVLDDDTP